MRLVNVEPLENECKACIGNKWNQMTAPLSWAIAEESFLERLEEAETIDAVPVVRCKDCKHRRDYGDIARGYYCVKRPSNCGRLCEDNDYCSYGERKDGE